MPSKSTSLFIVIGLVLIVAIYVSVYQNFQTTFFRGGGKETTDEQKITKEYKINGQKVSAAQFESKKQQVANTFQTYIDKHIGKKSQKDLLGAGSDKVDINQFQSDMNAWLDVLNQTSCLQNFNTQNAETVSWDLIDKINQALLSNNC